MSSIYQKLPELFPNVPCPVVFEIGAHTGGDTETIMDIVPVGRYFSFEPDPRNAIEYREMWAHSGKVQFIEAAVADVAGWAPYHASYPYTGSGSLKTPKLHLERFPDVMFKAQEMVQAVTLDGIFNAFGLDRIDFIWCDVQGSEDLVIKGGQRTLNATRWLYTEYYNEEIYEGQIPLEEIEKRLPGEWELAERWPTEALFRNKLMRG